MKPKQWSIQMLAIALRKDLNGCTGDFERSNCEAIYRKDIRECALAKVASGKGFTPGEFAILADLGIE